MSDFSFTLLRSHFQRETLTLPKYLAVEHDEYIIEYAVSYWSVLSVGNRKRSKHKFYSFVDAVKYADWLTKNKAKAEFRRRSKGVKIRSGLTRKEANKLYWAKYKTRRKNSC
jgi:hypothetical protein